MSRTTDSSPNSSPDDSPRNRAGDVSEPPSSSSQHPHHRRPSEGSEGYPSWLPKRPPPPAPASTFHSSVGMFPEAGPSEPFTGGRKATPRSVRIVSLQDEKDARREPTDQTRVEPPSHRRVWSRARGARMPSSLFNPTSSPRPRFRSAALHLELLRSPSWKSRLLFYLFPLFVFAHIPIQTFFDFNAVFILLQVAKFPNPEPSGAPGSGRNWALGAAAYIACWATWIFVVLIVYDLIYSFSRRWRVKRPLIMPLYFSSTAFNLVSMTSYTNFCFFRHLRVSAFKGENGSLWDGLAETCWFYSQNLPTVALLLPRAGLCLALLLTFSSSQAGGVALADAGITRDGTFFRASDGALTDYARGVLIANAAWTAWRALVLLGSWLGLWILSGQGCAGLCGPRYRWEEDDVEKTQSIYGDSGMDDPDVLPWAWKECTRLRVQEAWEFCLTVKPPRWGATKKEPTDATAEPVPFDGVEQVLAAVGFPSVPAPARRGVLSDDLFESPKEENAPPELSTILPRVITRSSREKQVMGPEAPLMTLPYPFKGYGAQVSSEDRIPFPPSPAGSREKEVHGEEVEEDEEDDDNEEEEEDEEDEEEEDESEEPSSGRASGSMSSLGRPVISRYPFQFRRPARGGSVSSIPSHMTPHSQYTSSPSSNSRVSRSTQSTGNRESSDSPMSYGGSSSGVPSPMGPGFSPIPMPPRHPRGRARAGTVPSVPSSPSPVNFPRKTGRPRARTRVESAVTDAFGHSGYEPSVGGELDESMMEQPEPEGPHEAAEQDDNLGLLSSAGPSPKSSFVSRHRPSSLLLGRRSRSGSKSRRSSQSGSSSSRSRTESSISAAARSRTQSMVQSFGAASRSSIELVQAAIRSRANSSMARLEEDASYSGSHSRSGSGSDAVLSSPENHTFGHPLRTQWQREEEEANRISEERSFEEGSRPVTPAQLRESHSQGTVAAPSEHPLEQTESGQGREPEGIPIPTLGVPSVSSHPDISTAATSFVTAPATLEGVSDSSGRTPSSWGGMSQMVEGAGGTWKPA